MSETAPNLLAVFDRALSMYSDYAAEIDDYGSDSAGQFSERLLASRIAVNRGDCCCLDILDVDPIPFLVLFHGACEPVNRATLADFGAHVDANSLDCDAYDEDDLLEIDCKSRYREEAQPMLHSLEMSGRADAQEIRVMAVLLSSMHILSSVQSTDVTGLHGEDGIVPSVCFHERDHRTCCAGDLDDTGDDDLDSGRTDDYEELHFD